jgi:hypothetical protein
VIFVSVIDIGLCKDKSLNADGTSKKKFDMATFKTGLIALFQEKTGHAIAKKESMNKVIPKRRLAPPADGTLNVDRESNKKLDMATFKHGLIALFQAKKI